MGYNTLRMSYSSTVTITLKASSFSNGTICALSNRFPNPLGPSMEVKPNPEIAGNGLHNSLFLHTECYSMQRPLIDYLRIYAHSMVHSRYRSHQLSIQHSNGGESCFDEAFDSSISE